MPAQRSRATVTLLSIGQVLAHLTPDFPDLSPSKLRFLEDKGLLSPARTPSGYRKFSQDDLERLRFILLMQRDYYLPLKVIRQHLDELDAGESPAIPVANVDVRAASMLDASVRLTRDELIRDAGGTPQLVSDAASAALIPARAPYNESHVQIVQALVELQRVGIEPRHMRGMRLAAEREAALIESALRPAAQRRDAASRAQTQNTARELAGHIHRVRELLSQQAIDTIADGPRA